MQMTEGEILNSYRHAKEKGKQIKILAELNACPVSRIEEILTEAGYLLNGHPRKGPLPKSVINTLDKENSKKEEKGKSPKISAARISRKTEKGINTLEGEVYVSKNVKNILDEKLYDMKESVARLMAECDHLLKDVRIRHKELEEFSKFVASVKVKEEENG